MNEKQIIEEAKLYISNDKTISDTACDLGISKRTLQLHIKKLEAINPELYKLVLEKKESNQKAGRRIGGSKGKKGVTYTSEKALEVASEIVSQHLTYQGAEALYGMPSSTIYDMVHSDCVPLKVQEQLDLTAYENQRRSVDEDREGHFRK